jgi:diacylglycerol kinase family enzyme
VLAAGEDGGALADRAARVGAAAVGVAGGDGSLARVAAVALERDVPFVVVPFGTRNHFARDVGLDPGDPLAALASFHGRERRVDVGAVDGRVFLNNVSLGLYASLVHDPNHRTKNRLVALARMGPAALGRSRPPLALSFTVHGRGERHDALVAVVANNDYGVETLADVGSRERLDEGRLHAYVIEAVEPRRLVHLLARAAVGRLPGAGGWVEYAAPRFVLESPRPRIHAAIDGEPVVLPGRVEFELRPRELRLLVPHSGDGGG